MMKTKKSMAIFFIMASCSFFSDRADAKPILESYSKIFHMQWIGPVPPKHKLGKITSKTYSSSIEKAKRRILALSERDILKFT